MVHNLFASLLRLKLLVVAFCPLSVRNWRLAALWPLPQRLTCISHGLATTLEFDGEFDGCQLPRGRGVVAHNSYILRSSHPWGLSMKCLWFSEESKMGMLPNVISVPP